MQDKERINEMIEAIMKVAKQDYSIKLEQSDNNDELDSLILGFNMMIDDLKKSTVGLEYVEDRVEEIIDFIQRAARGDYSAHCEFDEKNDTFDALIMGLNMMIDDVKASFEEIESAQMYTNNIITSMADTLIVVNPDATIRTVNRAIEQLLGYKEDELVGQPIGMIVKEEASLFGGDRFTEVMETGHIKDRELSYITKYAKEIPVSISTAIMRDPQGKLVGTVCIAKDLREIEQLMEQDKKRVEELEKAYQDIQATQDATFNMMEDLEIRGRELTALNEQHQQEIRERVLVEEVLKNRTHDLDERIKELKGLYGASKLMNETGRSMVEIIWEIVHFIPPSWQYPDITCSRFTLGCQEFTTDNFNKTKWKQSSNIIVSGKKAGVIEVYYLEERPKSDEGCFLKEERELIDTLAREIGRYIQRKQAEEKLKETMEELERSNQELGHFAYVASHDLQEPLRMVASYVQLLKKRYKGKLDDDADEFIGFAVDGAKRMQGLINDLLTYSRVGTKGKPFEPTNSETIFKQATDNLKIAIEESAAVITHEPLPTVMADGSQLSQLLQNLIGNGIKFKSDGQPQINVSAQKKDNEWLFSVHGNGIGIDPKDQERIFKIFQRLHSRSEYPGTGIGLAVCKKIVERHGGRIWVESEPGEGSTFYFTIPKKGGERT